MFKFRPWGFWLVLWQWPLFSKGPRYKLKLLYFKKGGAISKQRHKHRMEWWNFIGYKLGDGEMYVEYRDGDADGDDLGLRGPMIYANRWHQYKATNRTLVLETQRGICMEDDIERIEVVEVFEGVPYS